MLTFKSLFNKPIELRHLVRTWFTSKEKKLAAYETLFIKKEKKKLTYELMYIKMEKISGLLIVLFKR